MTLVRIHPSKACIFIRDCYIPTGVPYYLDVPACNAAALDLLESHGMKVVFETMRMYLGRYLDHSLDRTYAITRFELG